MARSKNPNDFETRVVCTRHSVFVEWSVSKNGPVSDVSCKECEQERSQLLGPGRYS